jgi:hypothetical protein
VQIINGGDDGQVLVAYLDSVASGATVKVKLTIRAVEDTPFTDISNTASVFYRESVADQTSLDLTVSSNNLAVPASLASQSSEATESEAGAERSSSTNEVAKDDTTTASSDQETAPATEPSAATAATDTKPSTEPADAETASAEAEPPESAFAPPQADDDSLLPKTGQASAGGQSQSNATVPLTASVLLLLGFVAYGVKSVRQRTV